MKRVIYRARASVRLDLADALNSDELDARFLKFKKFVPKEFKTSLRGHSEPVDFVIEVRRVSLNHSDIFLFLKNPTNPVSSISKEEIEGVESQFRGSVESWARSCGLKVFRFDFRAGRFSRGFGAKVLIELG